MTGDNHLLSKFALSGQPCGESTNVGVPGRGISDGGAARRCRYLSITLTTPQLPAGTLGSFVARQYVDGFSKRAGIQANVDIPRDLKRLSPDLELVLFRILQETLTNVHRHAQSPSVDIRVELDGDHITLMVRDYGKGMPPELLEKLKERGRGGGVGLNGMRERILQFGGRFEIQSDTWGTSIRATVPLSSD